MWLYMEFMVAFDSWIIYHCLCPVYFPFSYWISTRLKKNPSAKLFFFSKKLSILRNSINFLTNLSVDQTDLPFQVPNLE